MQDKNTPSTGPITPVYVGIDVSKSWLDVYIDPACRSSGGLTGTQVRVRNDRSGFRQLKRTLASLPADQSVALIVLEATSRLHKPSHRSLHESGWPVAVFNPFRVRQFAEATGQLAKTDRLDARTLARLAQSLRPEPRPPAPEAFDILQELISTRQSLLEHRIGVDACARAGEYAIAQQPVRSVSRSLQRQIDVLEQRILAHIASDAELQRRFNILTSIPGVGPIAAAALTGLMHELGAITGKAAAALAGVAPVARDSGLRKGVRRVRGGRKLLRRPLYMAALSASQHNEDLRDFYKRKCRDGKHKKIVLAAVMRKLVVLANILITQDRTWKKNAPDLA